MKYILLFLLIFTGQPEAKGAKNKLYGALFVDEVVSIYDGDTFKVNIKNLHPLLGERINIRVSGVDTPEIKGKCELEKKLARKAKQITVSFLRAAKYIELRNVKRGKYFRIVADVYADNESLTQVLLRSGYAVAYSGKKKNKNWCL